MLDRNQSFDLESYKPKKEGSKKTSKHSAYKGLFLAMLSGAFFSIASAIVKQMRNIHPGQLATIRFIGIFVFSLPGAVKSQENILGPKNLRFLLFLRGISGATSLFLMFLAFRYLPLAEATVIIQSAPIFITVAARIVLREACGIFQSIILFITVIGIIFTTKLPLKSVGNSLPYTIETIYGLLGAIGSLLANCWVFIIVRKVKNVHHSIILLNFGLVGIIETTVLTAIIGNFDWSDCGLQSILIIVLAVVSFAGQTVFTMALQCELAGPVSTMIAASDIALAFIWQTFFFHNIPDMSISIGAVLIGISVIFVGMMKWVSVLPEDSINKNKFGWMLK